MIRTSYKLLSPTQAEPKAYPWWIICTMSWISDSIYFSLLLKNKITLLHVMVCISHLHSLLSLCMARLWQAFKEMTEEVCTSPNSFRFTLVKKDLCRAHPNSLTHQHRGGESSAFTKDLQGRRPFLLFWLNVKNLNKISKVHSVLFWTKHVATFRYNQGWKKMHCWIWGNPRKLQELNYSS